MEKKNSENREEKLCTLEEFLKETQEGKYAIIDRSSFPYIRVEEQREEYYGDEELYFYSTR